MRKYLLTLCFVLLSFGLANAEEKVWTVAIDSPYPPFAYEDEQTGKLTGFDFDIAEALCKQLNIKCDIQVVPFEEILPRMVEGKVDIGIAGMGTTEERIKSALFTERYYRSNSIYIGKPNAAIISPKGLKGKRIGVQADTIQEKHLRETYTNIANIVLINTIEELMSAVQSSKIDLAFVDGLPGYYQLKLDQNKDLTLIDKPVFITSNSLIAVNKRTPEMVDKINQAIQDIRKSGEYDRINRKYFDFNIY